MRKAERIAFAMTLMDILGRMKEEQAKRVFCSYCEDFHSPSCEWPSK